MVDMNDSKSWDENFRYEQWLRDVDNINYFGLWAQDSKCYEQRWAVVDIKDFGLWA